MPSKDLRNITDDWPHMPGQINVRKIRGEDRRVKIQMRLDLGLLQMEESGRPDGVRPHDRESLLEHHRQRIAEHRDRDGTDLGYALTPEECREIREEALQYYQRYLANFALEDYAAVARDTRRNLDVLNLCTKYAEEDDDRYGLEQYRPYILMMHARSQALLAMQTDAFRTALAHVERALTQIKAFFKKFGAARAYRSSAEVQALRALRKEIRRHLPVDPVRRLEKKLAKAVADERYEDAARLRDELDTLRGQNNDPNVA